MARFEPVDTPEHPLAADFVALNDPARRRRIERAGDYFVVEGLLAIERLLELDGWELRSLLLLPRPTERLRPLLDPIDVPVGIADEDVLRAIVGFDLHRGALASVRRRPPLALGDLRPVDDAVILVAEGVNDHENLGALYRNAAGFGAAAVALDPTCADPFYRRAVRVSLGHVLAVPTVGLGPFPAALDDLHRAGLTTIALTPGGDTDLWELPRPRGPIALLVGAEGPGLTPAVLAGAQHQVRIDLATDVDSLNVATAAAIGLHHLRR